MRRDEMWQRIQAARVFSREMVGDRLQGEDILLGLPIVQTDDIPPTPKIILGTVRVTPEEGTP